MVLPGWTNNFFYIGDEIELLGHKKSRRRSWWCSAMTVVVLVEQSRIEYYNIDDQNRHRQSCSELEEIRRYICNMLLHTTWGAEVSSFLSYIITTRNLAFGSLAQATYQVNPVSPPEADWPLMMRKQTNKGANNQGGAVGILPCLFKPQETK